MSYALHTKIQPRIRKYTVRLWQTQTVILYYYDSSNLHIIRGAQSASSPEKHPCDIRSSFSNGNAHNSLRIPCPKPHAETYLILLSLLVSHDCMPIPKTNTSLTVSLRGDGRGETAAGGRYGLCCNVEE
jgi:hypothetical protein